jgi:tetratricopeptide (TPR) repeat protein
LTPLKLGWSGKYSTSPNSACTSLHDLRRTAILYRYYIADSHFLAGDYQEAEALFLTLIKESAEQDFHRAMITGWLSLAQIALRRGEIAEVVVRLQKADVLAQEFKHRRYVGEIHRVWSQVHALRGELPAARASLSEAIDIFERLGLRRELTEAREELRRLDDLGEAPAA